MSVTEDRGVLRTTWLCGDNRCQGELERMPDRHAYRCLSCGEEWEAQRTFELNFRDVMLPEAEWQLP